MPEKRNLISNRSWRPRMFPQFSSCPESRALICPEYGKNEKSGCQVSERVSRVFSPLLLRPRFCLTMLGAVSTTGSYLPCGVPSQFLQLQTDVKFLTASIIGRLCTNTTWETAGIVKWCIGRPRWQRTYRSTELICHKIRLQLEPTQSGCRKYTLCCHSFDLQIENRDTPTVLFAVLGCNHVGGSHGTWNRPATIFD